MSRSKLPKLKKAQKEIILTATNLANKRAREVILDNPQVAQQLVNLTQKNLTVLRRSWAPFLPDFEALSGFGMTLHINDPLVRKLLGSEGLYEIAEQIGADAVKSAIRIHEKSFITTMLEDLIMRPSAESFYGSKLAWPGEQHGGYFGDQNIR
jgi:hypothetical protein